MKFPNGITEIDGAKTFKRLRFAGMQSERRDRGADGNLGEIKKRTYNLKCSAMGGMIQVGLDGSLSEKQFAQNAEVELVNPVMDTVAEATFNGATATWYITADDIVPAGRAAQTYPNSQNVKAEPEKAADKKPEGGQK